MNTSIKTLAELQREKKKLKMEIEVSKREFIHSFGYTKTSAKDFLVNKVALPAGALGLAAIGLKKITDASNNESGEQVNAGSANNNSNVLLSLLPVVLPLIRTYFTMDGKKLEVPSFLKNLIAPPQHTMTEE